MIARFNKAHSRSRWRLVWSLLALLAYSVQSMGLVNAATHSKGSEALVGDSAAKSAPSHLNITTNHQLSDVTLHVPINKNNATHTPMSASTLEHAKGCHGERSESAVQAPIKAPATDCCEGGCWMMDCHAISALASTVSLPQVYALPTQNPCLALGFETKPNNRLYRPPSNL